jgi:hypothetical protein
MAGTASAAPITYTFNETSAEPAFYSLVSATGYLTFDTSLFTPALPGQDDVTYRTATQTNLSAFDFVFVTDVNGTNVTQEFTLADIPVGEGAIFDSTTNPPSYFDNFGPDPIAVDSLNPSLTMQLHIAQLGGEGHVQVGVEGEYNEFAEGTFTADALPTEVPEPLTLSLFGAGLAGAAAIRRRRKLNKV